MSPMSERRKEKLQREVLGWLGRAGGLSGWPRRAIESKTGFKQVLTRRRAVTALLELDDVTVPYVESANLGLERFPLSLDGPAHAAARARVKEAIDRSTKKAHKEGVVAAGALAEELLEGRVGTIDVVTELIDPCLHVWVSTWFGLTGPDAPDAELTLGTSRLVTHGIFMNPSEPKQARNDEVARLAAAASATYRAAVEPLVTRAGAGTLVAELVARTRADELALAMAEATASGGATPLTEGETAAISAQVEEDLPRHVAADVLGLTVGPLTLGSWSLVNALMEMLEAPGGLDWLNDTTDPLDPRKRFLTAVGRRPPLPGIPRVNHRARQVLGESRMIDVPVGPVLAATPVAAAADPPREGAADLAFGAGHHACLGPELIADFAAAVLVPLAARKPALPVDTDREPIPGRGPKGVGPWSFPAHLRVVLAPVTS